MSSNKQTAVEFLIKEFSEILGPIDTKSMQDLLLMDAMNQAKEMEKQQLVDFYIEGCEDTYGVDEPDTASTDREYAERFYKSKFNK